MLGWLIGIYLFITVAAVIDEVITEFSIVETKTISYNAIVRSKDRVYDRDSRCYKYSTRVITNDGSIIKTFEDYDTYMNHYQGQNVKLYADICYDKKNNIVKQKLYL